MGVYVMESITLRNRSLRYILDKFNVSNPEFFGRSRVSQNIQFYILWVMLGVMFFEWVTYVTTIKNRYLIELKRCWRARKNTFNSSRDWIRKIPCLVHIDNIESLHFTNCMLLVLQGCVHDKIYLHVNYIGLNIPRVIRGF